MITHPLKIKAQKFAFEAHKDQKRKYTGEPYFNHCEEVANIVSSVEHTVEMIAAAYLHDTVEDCGILIEEIEQKFGTIVADLVRDLTDISQPEDGNRAARKAIDREHTAKASPFAKTIKLADLISNSKSITELDPDFAKVYLKEKKLLMEFLKEGNPILYQRAMEFIP